MDGNGTYVLVVDDLPDAADSLRELLVVWGYDAEARYGGAAALESVRTRPPAAVVLDVGMPRMDGFEFVARLRLVPGCERTPVVVVSGHTSEACQARGRELGIGHYLLKAADPNLLRELLSRLTMRPEPSRSRPTPRRRKNPRRGGAPSGDPGSGVEPTPDPSQEAVPCGS